MDYIIIFFSAFILSLLLTPLVRRAMLKLNIMDRPDGFRWNRRVVALMGGIAIFISFGLAILLTVKLQKEVCVILLGGAVIFLLGIIDDLSGTHPKVKFTAQLIVAFGVACSGVAIKILPYFWLNLLVTVFWIIGLTNALNLLDNMDGLSTGITIIAAFALFGLSLMTGQITVGLLALALAGSCLGFLKYNFSPAQIFMGDCGAMFLGYMLATLAILGGWQHSSPLFVSLIAPVLVLGVAVFDTTLVIILRLIHGRMPWYGGRDHVSHRLVSILGGSEKSAVLVLYGVGILMGGFALIMVKLNSSLMAIPITVILVTGLILFGIKLAKVECYEKHGK